jgi:hypothetical protein
MIDNDKFRELRMMMLVQELWYWYPAKTYISSTVELLDIYNTTDVIINFTPIDKQCHLNITLHKWENDTTEVFFATWYDNNEFERFTKEGRDIIDENDIDYKKLIEILKRANFKFCYEDYKKEDYKDYYYEAYQLKSK